MLFRSDFARLGDGDALEVRAGGQDVQTQVEGSWIGEGDAQRPPGCCAGAAAIAAARPGPQAGDQGEISLVNISFVVGLPQFARDPALAGAIQRGRRLHRRYGIWQVLDVLQAFFENQFLVFHAVLDIAEELTLEQAVLAYRDEWIIERGFHRLK